MLPLNKLMYLFGMTSLLFIMSCTTVAPHKGCYVADPYVNGVYTGECKNGIADGKGKAVGRDIYEGEFKDGQFDGEGVYIWEGGDRYIGLFKQGYMNGNGVVIYTNGERLVGTWMNGKIVDREVVNYY